MRNNLITTFTRISSPELTRGVPALEPCRYISNYDKDAQVLLMNSSFRPRLQIIYILGRRRCNFYHNTASRSKTVIPCPPVKSRGSHWINIHCRTNCKRRRREISMTGEFIFFQRAMENTSPLLSKKISTVPLRGIIRRILLRLQISLDKIRLRKKKKKRRKILICLISTIEKDI